MTPQPAPRLCGAHVRRWRPSAPQVFTITTAGEAAQRHDSILGRILDAALDSDDVEREPGLTVGRLWEAKTLVWAYEAPTVDPRDVEAMKLANPASWITEAFLRRQAGDPELTDAEVLQLHGCVWAPARRPGSRRPPGPLAPPGRRLEREKVVLAFDGSYRRDATVLVACTLDARSFRRVVAVWERPERAHRRLEGPPDRGRRDGSQAMEPPRRSPSRGRPSGLERRDRRLEGALTATSSSSFRRIKRGRGWGTRVRDRFLTGVLEGRSGHMTGSTVLARHVGHCNREGHGRMGGSVTKDHPDSPRKIDAAVAAVVAHDRARWHAENPDHEPLIAYA